MSFNFKNISRGEPISKEQKRKQKLLEIETKYFASADQTTPIPVLFGRDTVKGVNILPLFNIESKKESSGSGKASGKGGGGETEVYYASVCILFAVGQIHKIYKFWQADELLEDVTEYGAYPNADGLKIAPHLGEQCLEQNISDYGQMRIYDGTQTHKDRLFEVKDAADTGEIYIDTLKEDYNKDGSVDYEQKIKIQKQEISPNKGCMYMVSDRWKIGQRQLPNIMVECSRAPLSLLNWDGYSLVLGENATSVVNGEYAIVDTDSSDIIYTLNEDGDTYAPLVILELLRSEAAFGFGIPKENINLQSFIDAYKICREEGIAISVQIDEKTTLREAILSLLDYCDGIVYLDDEGKIAIKLIRIPSEGYTDVKIVNKSNLIGEPNITWSGWDDTWGRTIVKYTDRASGYEDTSRVVDCPLWNKGVMSGMVTKEINLPYVKDGLVAFKLARRIGIEGAQQSCEVEMQVLRGFAKDIKVGDVIGFQYANLLGGNTVYLRVVKKELGTPEDPATILTAQKQNEVDWSLLEQDNIFVKQKAGSVFLGNGTLPVRVLLPIKAITTNGVTTATVQRGLYCFVGNEKDWGGSEYSIRLLKPNAKRAKESYEPLTPMFDYKGDALTVAEKSEKPYFSIASDIELCVSDANIARKYVYRLTVLFTEKDISRVNRLLEQYISSSYTDDDGDTRSVLKEDTLRLSCNSINKWTEEVDVSRIENYAYAMYPIHFVIAEVKATTGGYFFYCSHDALNGFSPFLKHEYNGTDYVLFPSSKGYLYERDKIRLYWSNELADNTVTQIDHDVSYVTDYPGDDQQILFKTYHSINVDIGTECNRYLKMHAYSAPIMVAAVACVTKSGKYEENPAVFCTQYTPFLIGNIDTNTGATEYHFSEHLDCGTRKYYINYSINNEEHRLWSNSTNNLFDVGRYVDNIGFMNGWVTYNGVKQPDKNHFNGGTEILEINMNAAGNVDSFSWIGDEGTHITSLFYDTQSLMPWSKTDDFDTTKETHSYTEWATLTTRYHRHQCIASASITPAYDENTSYFCRVKWEGNAWGDAVSNEIVTPASGVGGGIEYVTSDPYINMEVSDAEVDTTIYIDVITGNVYYMGAYLYNLNGDNINNTTGGYTLQHQRSANLTHYAGRNGFVYLTLHEKSADDIFDTYTVQSAINAEIGDTIIIETAFPVNNNEEETENEGGTDNEEERNTLYCRIQLPQNETQDETQQETFLLKNGTSAHIDLFVGQSLRLTCVSSPEKYKQWIAVVLPTAANVTADEL